MTTEPSSRLGTRGALVGAFNGLEFIPEQEPVTGLSSVFNLGSGGSGEDERLRMTLAVGTGTLDGSKVSVNLNTGVGRDERAEADKKKREEQSFRDRMHQMLLNNLAFHEQQRDAAGDRLRETYGDDFVGGMAARYLSPEELASARTDEERLEALSKVFLDEHGNIRPEFEGRDEAAYVYHWSKANQRKAELNELPSASPERREEILQGVREEESVTLNAARNEIQQDEQATQVAEETIDNSGESAERSPTQESGFRFG